MSDASLWVVICRCPPCLDKVVGYDAATGEFRTTRCIVEITRTGNGKANMKIIDSVPLGTRNPAS
jgi:hypothetical protein